MTILMYTLSTEIIMSVQDRCCGLVVFNHIALFISPFNNIFFHHAAYTGCSKTESPLRFFCSFFSNC